MAIAAATSVVAVSLPMNVANAEPPPSPSPSPAPAPVAPPPGDPAVVPPPGNPAVVPPPGNPAVVPPPADPAAPPPAPVADPSAPPAPAPDPNAAPPPEPGRVNNAAGQFSFVMPGGWQAGDVKKLNYGQALLQKVPAAGTTESPKDASIILGRLDLKLFAGAEADNTKSAVRLASDMGEFYMPFPGTRVNQETIPLNANGMPGAASYYEVKFNDTTKPNGQIWAAAIGTTTPRVGQVEARNDRWFVVWLGTATNPVDKGAAKALAESIRPWTPPPPPAPAAPPPADPNAPPPDPNAPPGRAPVGVPRPVDPNSVPPGLLPQG